MKESIIRQLHETITTDILNLPSLAIGADEALITSGLIDSFSLVDIALFVEDTFGVKIDDTELNAETFDTLNQLAELILKRQE